MVNTKKFFAAAGQLENDILKPRCSHEDAKPLGTRLRTQQKQRAGSIPPALKQQAIDESVPYTDILEANKQK